MNTAFVDAAPSAPHLIRHVGILCGTWGGIPNADRPYCSDNSDGLTPQTAWATLQYAVDHVPPGGTIYVHQPAFTPSPDDRYSEQVVISRAGSPSQPFRIMRAPEEMVSSSGFYANPTLYSPMHATQNRRLAPLVFVDGAAYWSVEGLSIDCEEAPVVGITLFNTVNVQPRIRSIALRFMDVRRCDNGGAVVTNSEDILFDRNHFIDNARMYPSGDAIQDAHGILVTKKSSRILVRGNTITGSSGDAFQCQGRETPQDGWTPEQLGPSTDITLENNTFTGDFENAVDIKECVGVTVRNGVYSGYRPKSNTATQCGGDAVIFHFGSSNILFENNRISDSGLGVMLGNNFKVQATDSGPTYVSNVVIRRNQIFRMTQDGDGDATNGTQTPGIRGGVGCADGIRIDYARDVDIYNNTFDEVGHSAIRLGIDGWNNDLNARRLQQAVNVHVWNNIIRNTGTVQYLEASKVGQRKGGALDFHTSSTYSPGLTSNYNLVFNTSGPVLLRKDNEPDTFAPRNLAQWKSATGLDAASFELDPLFDPNSAHTGYMTLTGSPARNAALDDTNNDNDPTVPCGSPARLDLGAVESDCGVGSTPSGEWQRQRGTSDSDQYNAVVTDSAGNVYAAGYSRGSFGFTNQGKADAILKQHSATGNNGWTRQLGGSEDDQAYALAYSGTPPFAPTQHYLYMVGLTTGPLPGTSTSSLVPAGFVAQYDTAGNRGWTQRVGTSGFSDLRAVAVDAAGDVYVAGGTWGYETGGGMPDGALILIAKLSGETGAILWKHVHFGNTSASLGPTGIALDAQGNIFVAGEIRSSSNAQPIAGFIGKYSADGTQQLAHTSLGGLGITSVSSLARDTTGALVIGGFASGLVPGKQSAGGQEGVVAKLSAADFSPIWLELVGTWGDDAVNAVAVDPQTNNIWVAGRTGGPLNGFPNYGGGADFFLWKWSPTGSPTSTFRQAGTGLEEEAMAVCVDPSGNAVSAGWTSGALLGQWNGSTDAVLLKKNP
ncbi:SBBP repeat-containing protein [Corallococcus macrosporus]|uniref:SBBP repeat-containing protein n=1 Tax=Corallococcus macrosporus TaxID=35 RepID=A0ABS3DBA8_9BACT|nr:SBBP repeat-containing protein [Corallococcus macrosporus]MBN8228969.1 SBBP repeat-containing protein [Corallococcus macrosporus]